MIYEYKCGNEIIRVFVWNDEFHNTVSVEDPNTNSSYDRTIREDKNGKFFTWNKNKIYLDDWIRITLRELKERVENDEWVISDDLCQAILTDGIENARFIVPLNTISFRGFGTSLCNGNEYKDTICRIEGRWNREVKQNYKIILVPLNNDEDVANYQDYYTLDFISLIKSGHIKIVA